MVQARTRIEGMERVRRFLSDPKVVKGPLRRFLETSAQQVEKRAKEKVVSDRGRLRGSITRNIEPMRAVVGSNLVYAPFVEFGTRPHWPPLKALQPWARRHGFPPGNRGAFLVARKIAQKGTDPQPYLLPAFNESKGDIERNLQNMADEIGRKWGRE